jgi:hypothetical protein
MLTVSFQGQCQHYNSVISDGEIESFIQWEIDNTPKYSEDRKYGKKKLLDKPESWKTSGIGKLLTGKSISFETRLHLFFENDTLFDNEDREFIKSQYETEIIKEWRIKFENVNIKKKPNLNYHGMTVPLFSKDKSKVIIWKYFYCGSLCGHSCIFIYDRIGENDWKEIGRFGCEIW